MVAIKDVLNYFKQNPNLLLLQEAREELPNCKGASINVKVDVVNALKKAGMTVVTAPYNTVGYDGKPDSIDMRMKYIIVYDEQMGDFKGQELVYFTENCKTDVFTDTQSYKDFLNSKEYLNLDNENKEVSLKKKHLNFTFGEKFPRCALRFEFEKDGRKVFVYNVHLSLSAKVKMNLSMFLEKMWKVCVRIILKLCLFWVETSILSLKKVGTNILILC